MKLAFATILLLAAGCVSLPSVRTAVKNGKEYYVLDLSGSVQILYPEIAALELLVNMSDANSKCNWIETSKITDYGWLTLTEISTKCGLKHKGARESQLPPESISNAQDSINH